MLIDIQIPEWANWVAQDANGSYWVYEEKPIMLGGGWWPHPKTKASSGRLRIASGTPPADWTKTLKRVER